MMKDLQIFALTLYFEAGSSQNIEDVLSVAFTIKTRVEKSKKSYYEICTAPLQFSCWNNKKPEDIKIDEGLLRFRLCKVLAEYVMVCIRPDWNPVQGATLYYNPKLCNPKDWDFSKLEQVIYDPHIDHLFFKLRV